MREELIFNSAFHEPFAGFRLNKYSRLYLPPVLGGIVQNEMGATFGNAVHALSLVAGNAFFAASGIDLSKFAGIAGARTPCKLILKDSAGKVAWGWIAEADEAFALSGSELLTNPGFETVVGTDDDTTDDTFTGWTQQFSIPSGTHQFSVTDRNSGARACKLVGKPSINCYMTQATVALAVGTLYRVGLASKGDGTNTGSLDVVRSGPTYLIPKKSMGLAAASWATMAAFFTCATAMAHTIEIYGPDADGFCIVDDISFQAVSHIGATGIHIVSAQNGSTRDWTSIEAGFNYNDSAYAFEVWKEL